MKNQLLKLKTEASTLMAEADQLQAQRIELLSPAQQPLPDIAGIEARLLSALGAGDDAARKNINNELIAAKMIAKTVQTAKAHLDDVLVRLTDIYAQSADLAEQMRPIQAAILAEEACTLGAVFKEKAGELMGLFLAARSMALEAESLGHAAIVPAGFRHIAAFDLPCPVIGLSQFGRLSVNVGAATDTSTQSAVQAAKQRALELI